MPLCYRVEGLMVCRASLHPAAAKVDGKRIGEDAGSLACDVLSVLRVA